MTENENKSIKRWQDRFISAAHVRNNDGDDYNNVCFYKN